MKPAHTQDIKYNAAVTDTHSPLSDQRLTVNVHDAYKEKGKSSMIGFTALMCVCLYVDVIIIAADA